MTAWATQGGAAGTRRRILMIAACPFPAPRGTPVRVHRIAESLAARGHVVDVVTYHLGERATGLPFRIHRIARVPTYTKLDPGPSCQKLTIVDGLLTARVLQLAWTLRPDVIHAHHYEGLLTGLPARHLLGIPLVFDSHVLLQSELDYYPLPGLGRRRKSRIGRLLDRHLTRRADHVIAVTGDIRARLVQDGIMDPGHVTVAGNGVEEDFYAGHAGAFPADGARRLLFTGNLALYQGVERMLQALALLSHRRSDVRLIVATGSDRRAFAELAEANGVAGRIDFVDANLRQLPDLIASADIALNPRTACPGVPQKLLNYMAAGAAVVSFAGSAKHLRHEESGLVVPDDDVAGFSAAILRLLDDTALRKRLGVAARQHARQFFSWANSAAIIEDVYEQVLSHQRPGPISSAASALGQSVRETSCAASQDASHASSGGRHP